MLYQDDAARINSVKEVRLKESEQAMSLKSNGFRGENSELHRAAEKAAKQMIRFLHIRREARKNALA